MLSGFGVEHPLAKGRQRDTAAAGTGAVIGAVAAPRLHQAAELRSSAKHIVAHDDHQRAADVLFGSKPREHGAAASHHFNSALRGLRRARSVPLRRASTVAGATAGALGAVAVGRAVSRRHVRKSAFGIEYELAKGLRPDKMIEAVATGRKGKLEPLATPLADAKLGPRVAKSAFGVVHKGPLAAADGVALAPGRVKAVTATVRPGQAIPSATKKPLAERLNGAIAATGGSPS